MASDRLVVYVDHLSTGVHMNFTPVVLSRGDLTYKVSEIITGAWGWTPEDIDVNGDKTNAFLIEPKLWRGIGSSIKWPDVSEASQETQDAVTRCKICVYKAMKMHWGTERARAYARISEAHREEILTMTGGNLI